MKGSEIISKLGYDYTHDFVHRTVFQIDPDYDYVIVRGTEELPKVITPETEHAVNLGRYPRLKIEGRELIVDPPWVTGHHPFENKIEPRRAWKRPKTYMIQ